MSRPETVELWRQRLQQFDPSSMTVAQFCQLEGVSQASFYKWRKTLRELSQQPSPRPIQPEVSFVPLRLSAVAENRVDVATDHAEHLPIAPPLASTTIERNRTPEPASQGQLVLVYGYSTTTTASN